jgi:hypothetical protein
LKLYSKEVKVTDFQIKSNVTQEMIDDLRNMKSIDQIIKEDDLRRKQEIRRNKINQINKISNEE